MTTPSLPPPFYQEDSVTIYHGDCRQIVPLLGGFDLLLTDPPYGLGIAANPVRQKHARLAWDESAVQSWLLQMLLEKARMAIIWGGQLFFSSAAAVLFSLEQASAGRRKFGHARTSLDQYERPSQNV